MAREIMEGSELLRQAQAAERTNDYARAERLHKEAIRVKERGLGPNHASTGTSYNALREFYFQRAPGNLLDDAEHWLKKALDTRYSIDEHNFDSAMTRENLAQVYEAKGTWRPPKLCDCLIRTPLPAGIST